MNKSKKTLRLWKQPAPLKIHNAGSANVFSHLSSAIGKWSGSNYISHITENGASVMGEIWSSGSPGSRSRLAEETRSDWSRRHLGDFHLVACGREDLHCFWLRRSPLGVKPPGWVVMTPLRRLKRLRLAGKHPMRNEIRVSKGWLENVVRRKASGFNCQSQNKHKLFLSCRNFMHYVFYSLSFPHWLWFRLPLGAELWGPVVHSVLWLWLDGGGGARSCWPTAKLHPHELSMKVICHSKSLLPLFSHPSYYVNLFPECLTRFSSGRSGTASEVKHRCGRPSQKLAATSPSFLPDNEVCDYHLDRL